jgi:cytochrome c
MRAGRTSPTRRIKTIQALGVICLAIAFGTGCDSYSEVRDTLSEPERQRFDRGMRAAVPCWSCHDITGSAIKVGPPLRGFMGRPAGTSSEYRYSDPLIRSGVVWTAASLNGFLTSPARFIPGNRMTSPGVGGASTRSDLIFFLERVTAPPATGDTERPD